MQPSISYVVNLSLSISRLVYFCFYSSSHPSLHWPLKIPGLYIYLFGEKNPRVYIEERGKERQKKFFEIPKIRIIQKFECIILNFPNLDFFPGIGKNKREGISKNLDDIFHPIFILHLLLKLSFVRNKIIFPFHVIILWMIIINHNL